MQNNHYDEEFILPEAETVTLTRAEIEALNAYAEKVRRETVKAIFKDVKNMLHARYRMEDHLIGLSTEIQDRIRYLHGRDMCETLLIDLKKIEGKYEE